MKLLILANIVDDITLFYAVSMISSDAASHIAEIKGLHTAIKHVGKL